MLTYVFTCILPSFLPSQHTHTPPPTQTQHHDRGFAFIDLGSQEAVARAVSASLSNEGIRMRKGGKGGKEGDKLVVEPSKKPVRPSGVKAINERKNSGSLSPKLVNAKGKAVIYIFIYIYAMPPPSQSLYLLFFL
jgi:hypothetical protein